MKIKHKNSTTPLLRRARGLSGGRRALPAWAARSGSVLLVAALLFSVFRYGVHLKEAGITTYFNNTLRRVAHLDFSFVGNYARGRMADFDEIAIDIKFKHLLRLQYLRERSLEEGLILPEFKNEEFPAKMTYKGKTHEVKIALTGLVAHSHLRNPNKWSFEVKVKGDDTMLGMKRFALLLPSTRGYLTDWLGFELMKDRGMMGFRVDFVNVSFNGKSTGVYYLEERFDKHLIENNSFREGIMFKIEEGLQPYQESKLMADPSTRNQLLLIRRMWQQVQEGDLPLGQFFDMKKMASVFVICDLMNNQHPLAAQNLRYYFNPVTGLAEPIAREWEELDNNDQTTISVFLEDPIPGTRHYRFEKIPFLRMIYDNPEFKSHYIREAAEICQVQYLDRLLLRNEAKIDALLERVYHTWPFYELPSRFLYENQAHMRSVLFPEGQQLSAWYNQREGAQISLHLVNLQDMPLEVAYLSWRDSLRFYPERPAVLDSRAKAPEGGVQFFNFRIPEGVSWDDALAGELTAHYNLLGLEPAERTAPVRPWSFESRFERAEVAATAPASYASFSFIQEEAGTGAVVIPEGKWTIDRDLVIPAGKRLVIAAGATADLSRQARIISYGPVFCEGTEEKPVLVTSSDGTGRGIAVIGAQQGSALYHTTFERLAGPRGTDGQQYGAISFYRSPVTIRHCTFSGDQEEGACLGIARSEFLIEHARFSNISGHALKGAFCKGAIVGASFAGIGGNGIDVSGSQLKMSHIFMNNIAGQGIRVGEDSDVQARWADLRNTTVGAGVTDGARFAIQNARFANNRVGIAAYQEKPAFGPPSATASKVEIEASTRPWLVEKHSAATLDGIALPENGYNVKDLLNAEAIRPSLFN